LLKEADTQEFLFARNFENFSGFRSTETLLEISYGFDIPKFRSQRIPESIPEVSVGRKKIRKTNNFGKTKFWFENPEVSVQKSRSFGLKTPSFGKKTEVSVKNPKVSSKIFELETSVKVVLRNASVAETQNFELLYTNIHF
jgi:hypothetical protein